MVGALKIMRRQPAKAREREKEGKKVNLNHICVQPQSQYTLK